MSLIIFIFGLIIGSFLNAVIWRLHEGISFLKGRSLCPKCQHKLVFKDLIPLASFLIQKGKCRYCQKSISWQYPLVELATAILFTLTYFKYWNLEFSFWISLFFISILFIIFVYDLRWYLILDKVTLPAIILALIINLIRGFSFFNLLLAVLVGGGFFLAQFIISKGRWIGGGDIRLGALMGAMLGWPSVLVALFMAYFAGAIVGIFLIITKKKKWQSQVPFGTFLSFATVVGLLYGEEILGWYLELII